MSLSEPDLASITDFRDYLEGITEGDDRYGSAERVDKEDLSTLATRFSIGENCWLELAIHPLLPQVRVGIVTGDRWVNEQMEQAIEDSGDSMSEFVEGGFAEVGLNWPDPPVEHYREDGTDFHFATPLALQDLMDLDDDALRTKIIRMLEAYLMVFGFVAAHPEEEE